MQAFKVDVGGPPIMPTSFEIDVRRLIITSNKFRCDECKRRGTAWGLGWTNTSGAGPCAGGYGGEYCSTQCLEIAKRKLHLQLTDPEEAYRQTSIEIEKNLAFEQKMK